MTTTIVDFNLLDESRPFAPQRYRIGLVVRGMATPGGWSAFEGHADCVLPNGAPIGFFADTHPATESGESTASSGASVPDSSPGSIRGSTEDLGSSGGSTSLSGGTLSGAFTGTVYQYADFLRHRPQYVQRDMALSRHSVSTLLAIEVTSTEARLFEDAWRQMQRDPGQFGFVGWNCATHAGWAFARAGLLTTPVRALGVVDRTSEISFRDTPRNLYLQLIEGPANSRFESYSGYLGFEPIGHGHYRVTIDTASEDASAERSTTLP